MMTNEEEFNPIEQEPQPESAAEDAAFASPAAPAPTSEDGDSADSSSPVADKAAEEEPPAPADVNAEESESAPESEMADAGVEPANEKAAEDKESTDSSSPVAEEADDEEPPATADVSAEESKPAPESETADAGVEPADEKAAEDGDSTDSSSPVADEAADEEPSAPTDLSAEESEPAPEGDTTDEAGEPAPETPERPSASSVLKGVSTEEDDRNWYVIHCYSGYENKVRYNLEQRIESMGMKDMIFDVVIPTQEEIEVREGKRRSIERHVFPGYILVNLILTDESWFVVRNTPGVTGFVGMGNDPTPLRPEEVSQILKRMEADAPHMKVTFRSGERVRIIDGPFNDFRGTVADLDMDRAKVTVMVNFFGRETPVELDFLQVEKA
jgi:transcriptional antiterminator NusG